MKPYWVYSLFCFILSSCDNDKNNEWTTSNSIKQVPVYGSILPGEDVKEVAYIQGDSSYSLCIAAVASWDYYLKLNSLFNNGGGPVMHYDFSREIHGFSEPIVIKGESVYVFEGQAENKRRNSTFYYITDQIDESDHKISKGKVVIVFK